MPDQSAQATSAMPSLRSQASAQQRSSPEHKSYADSIAATSQAQNPPQEQVLAQAPTSDQKVVTQAQAGHPTQGDSLHAPDSISTQNPHRLDTYLDSVRAMVSPEDFKKLFSDHFCLDKEGYITCVVDGVEESRPFLMERALYVDKCRDKIKPLDGRAPAPGAFILKSIDVSDDGSDGHGVRH